jgi:glycosyltransferase involved in cell wall biosynthesis
VLPSKVLIVSPVATHPPHRGNRQRILQVARIFQQKGFDVEVALPRTKSISAEAQVFWPAIHQLEHGLHWRPTKKNVQLDAWFAPGTGEELAGLVRRRSADIVLMNYVFHSKALESLPDSVVKVIDTHDVFTARQNLYAGKKYSRGFFSCSPDTELQYLNRADIALAISDADKNFFNTLGTAAEIIELPFVWPEAEPVARRNHQTGPLHFGIVLSANDLNLSSLWDFISAVDTTYGKNVPFTVSVAGDIYRLAYQLFPQRYFAFRRAWLTFSGVATNLDAFYAQVDAAVVPTTAGSGMAVKFAESIGHGVPTVSTAIGSRGHPVTESLHALESNRELAIALGGLDREVLSTMSERSRELFRQMEERLAKQSSSLFSSIESVRLRG